MFQRFAVLRFEKHHPSWGVLRFVFLQGEVHVVFPGGFLEGADVLSGYFDCFKSGTVFSEGLDALFAVLDAGFAHLTQERLHRLCQYASRHLGRPYGQGYASFVYLVLDYCCQPLPFCFVTVPYGTNI